MIGFQGLVGPLRFLQCYIVTWIHVIEAICTILQKSLWTFKSNRSIVRLITFPFCGRTHIPEVSGPFHNFRCCLDHFRNSGYLHNGNLCTLEGKKESKEPFICFLIHKIHLSDQGNVGVLLFLYCLTYTSCTTKYF